MLDRTPAATTSIARAPCVLRVTEQLFDIAAGIEAWKLSVVTYFGNKRAPSGMLAPPGVLFEVEDEQGILENPNYIEKVLGLCEDHHHRFRSDMHPTTIPR